MIVLTKYEKNNQIKRKYFYKLTPPETENYLKKYDEIKNNILNK